jgi:hypothetical protein
MTDATQGRGRPAKPGKTTFNFRISADLRQMLVAAAAKSGLSLTEEAELRLKRDFAWEAAKGDIEELKRQALVWADAARVKAIREAGVQILREIDGNPKRVILDLETLLAEADGIARGLRSGFEPEAPPAQAASQQRAGDTNPWQRELKGRKVTIRKKGVGVVVSGAK